MKSLAKVLEVLDKFTLACPQWTLSELSRSTDLPLSTVHRIVSDLKEHGLLTQDPSTKRYRLGFGAIDLGYRALAVLEIPSLATPAMRRLCNETGETVHLTVPNDTRDHSVCVARADGQHDLRIHLEVGRQIPLHAGASAKVLLAYLSEDEIDDFILGTGLPALAPSTITDPDELKMDLGLIRSQGYAFSCEETHVGAWGLAVAILDQRGYPIAGVGISGPTSRYSPDKREFFVDVTKRAATDIGASIGLRYQRSCS
jgi:DNA-binding IclR family transcriptional regulator